jgi:hypothetical protein
VPDIIVSVPGAGLASAGGAAGGFFLVFLVLVLDSVMAEFLLLRFETPFELYPLDDEYARTGVQPMQCNEY